MFENSEIHDHITQSGLFDAAFYRRANQIADVADDDLLAHYIRMGEASNFRPNFLFEPKWYRENYNLANYTGSLLYHYITVGERAGHNPSALFHSTWYAEKYGVDTDNELCLTHYMRGRLDQNISPNSYFDKEYYLTLYPDLSAADIDCYEHFVAWGVFEGRRPSDRFDSGFIWRTYLNNDRSKNPFRVFLEFGPLFDWTAVGSAETATIAREMRKTTAQGPLFEARPPVFSGMRRAKALAFYLPQFHAIAENDAWWGAGFTEWRNIARGLPRFRDHYQPRIPRDLGFYSLESNETLSKQIALAKNAGIYGFCFYYYNFNGHRLLEKPLDRFLDDPTLSFPFCLMWANENWTRRWDGMEKDVLIGQDYRSADEKALISDLARYMKDDRYIRINARPILFLYRADVIPNVKETLVSWRKRFKEDHNLSPLIVMAQTFGNVDPRSFGFDAALEFPPHKFGASVPQINHAMEILDTDFHGDVRSYDDFISASMADYPSEYPLIKTVFPSWDNDARKQGSGMVVQGSSPGKFQSWVEAVAKNTEAHPVFGERIFCVNAWNEWCEGAYLEPDVHYGYAYLNAFSRAIVHPEHGVRRKIVLVGHDAFPAGAQQLLYHIGQTLTYRFGLNVTFILMGGGKLAKEYGKIAPTFVVNPQDDFWPGLVEHLKTLREDGYTTAITNSTFSGHIVGVLADLGFRVCSLIHELRTMVVRNHGAGHLARIFERSHHVVFPNAYVRDELLQAFGHPAGEVHVRAQGVYKEIEPPRPDDRQTLCRLLDVQPQTKIVLNAGYADLRKGVDLFVAIAQAVAKITGDIVFVWVGDADPAVDIWLLDAVRNNPSSNVRFLPFTDQIASFMNAADLFLLTSREDPFPSVLLEALSAGTPAAAFGTGGGFVELLKDPKLGFLIPPGDVGEAARMIVQSVRGTFATDLDLIEYRRSLVKTQFDFADYCFHIIGRAEPVQKISVVVPNYNYENYLESRIASVLNQTHPIFELIVLDDCSTDRSIKEIERVAGTLRRDLVLVENGENSGNVFAQWAKGVSMARGDLIWIAEADDLADPAFLDQLAPFFERRDMALAFSDSRTIDQDGLPQWESYKPYYESLFPGALSETAIFKARDFLETYLSVKNVILNVSSALWRREVLASALDRCANDLSRFRMAGDWRLYAEACLIGGAVGYNATALNIHRRHASSVTHSLKKEQHLGEIAAMHELIRQRGRIVRQHKNQLQYMEEVAAQFGMEMPVA